MSQADQVVQNASHALVRQDINDNIKALASSASGPSQPPVSEQGMFWYDTALCVIRQRNELNTNWDKLLWSTQEDLVNLTTVSKSIEFKDIGKLQLVDATAGVITITLLDSVASGGALRSHVITIKKIDSSANAVIIAAAGSDTIEGNPTLSLTAQNSSVTLRPLGSTWHVSSDSFPTNGLIAGDGIDITSNVIAADLDTVTPGLEFVGSLLNVNLETDKGLELVAGGLQAKAGNNVTVDATGISATGGTPDFQTTIALAANTNANLIHGLGSKPTRLLINVDGESAGGTPLGGEPIFMMINNVDTNGNGAYWGANATAIRGRWSNWGGIAYSSSGALLEIDTNLVFDVKAWL